jgi:hypothetical protein
VNAPRPADRDIQVCRDASPEAWPRGRSVKRLSIDIPADLHRRIKVSCAGRGTKIADEIRALLEQNFQSR